jgi:hypothetical protein
MARKTKMPADVVKLMLLAEQLADRFEQLVPNAHAKRFGLTSNETQNDDRTLLTKLRAQIEEVVRAAETRTPRVDIGLPVSKTSFGRKASMFVNRLIAKRAISEEATQRFKKQMCH